MMPLRFTSLVSTIADPFCAALAAYLTAHLPFAVTFVQATDREGLLAEDAVDLVWLCGLLYLHKCATGQRLIPAVAPAIYGETPANRAAYYGEMIVNNASTYQSFADLRGSRWAYNEEASFSGYQMVRAHLAQQRAWTPYFGQAIKSGAHLTSMAYVREGLADCAAIDSTVLQMAQRQRPALCQGLRTVARLGPYPMPLWAFCEHGARECQQPLIALLTQMHRDPAGRHLLAQWQIARFYPATAEEYESLHAVDELANQLHW